MTALAFSPDADRLASAYCLETESGAGQPPACLSSKVLLWDVSTGAKIAEFQPEQAGFIQALAFQNSGPLLALSRDDHTINVWNLQTLAQDGVELALPAGVNASSLAFSDDDSMLASGNSDKSLLLWDANTHQPIGRPMFGAPDTLLSLAYDRSTGDLFAGGTDGAVQKWFAAPAGWIPPNCIIAGRNMTQTEWEQFFPGEPYRLTCPDFPPG